MNLALKFWSIDSTPVRQTIDYIRLCQRARTAGHPISFTTDPTWLVDMAINRRAGWPDDPGFLRGSARPVNGKYPRAASDQTWSDLQRFARRVNQRGILRACEWRHIPERWRARVAHRIEE